MAHSDEAQKRISAVLCTVSCELTGYRPGLLFSVIASALVKEIWYRHLPIIPTEVEARVYTAEIAIGETHLHKDLVTAPSF